MSEILLAFLFAAKLSNRWVAVVAAMIMATLPIAVMGSRELGADLPAAVLAAWGVYAILNSWGARTTPAIILLGLLAGLLLGASWLTKETLVLMAPAFIALAAMHFRKNRRTVLVGTAACLFGLLAVVAAEAIFYYVVTGDALFRAHEMARNFEQCKENFFYQDSPKYGWAAGKYWQTMMARLLYEGPRVLIMGKSSLGLGALAICGTVYLWRRRVAVLRAPLLWMALLMLSFNFCSTSLAVYRPLVPAPEYSYAIMLPCALLVAAALCDVIKRARGAGLIPRLVVASLVIALFAVFVAASIYGNVRAGRAGNAFSSITACLPPSASVVTDYRTRFTLSYYRTGVPDFSDKIVTFEDGPAVATCEYLLLRRDVFEGLNYRYKIPDSIDVRKGWRLVQSTGGLQLFRRSP